MDDAVYPGMWKRILVRVIVIQIQSKAPTPHKKK
jgi:hypothetical protein